MPTDVDRQDRLFSLMFLGSGPGGTWTEQDWAEYSSLKGKLWKGTSNWQAENLAAGYDRFQLHLERLASYYGNDHEEATRFSRAVGLTWGGIAYKGSSLYALVNAAFGDHLLQLDKGSAGWISKYVDDTNPAHHWAGAFLTGFGFGTTFGVGTNSIRDIAQYGAGQGGTKEDILLGNVAVSHGDMLWYDTRGLFTQSAPYAVMFAEMRQDLRVSD